MNYTPGKGGAAVATVGTGAGVIATQLPQTGANLVDTLALAAVGALVAWAVAYMVMNRKNA